jgi:hypothetical protein
MSGVGHLPNSNRLDSDELNISYHVHRSPHKRMPLAESDMPYSPLPKLDFPVSSFPEFSRHTMQANRGRPGKFPDKERLEPEPSTTVDCKNTNLLAGFQVLWQPPVGIFRNRTRDPVSQQSTIRWESHLAHRYQFPLLLHNETKT